MSSLIVFAIDTSIGEPAEGLTFRLERLGAGGGWSLLVEGRIGVDGLAEATVGFNVLTVGEYRLVYEVGTYFRERTLSSLFQRICVDFVVMGDQPIVIPLLLGPYGYNLYKGS